MDRKSGTSRIIEKNFKEMKITLKTGYSKYGKEENQKRGTWNDIIAKPLIEVTI